MPPVTTQRKKTEGWSPITGADQMSNAMLMRTRCVCFAPVRVRCGAAAFFYLDGGFCLPCDPMKAHQTRRDKSFTFCRGFICCYSCSQTYSAWSNVWVLNVLPETAGRVSVHVSARRCACQRVCVCMCSNHSAFRGVLVRLQLVSVQKEDRWQWEEPLC